MKKYFLFLLIIFLCPRTYAQKWIVTHEPADELRGVGPATNYLYKVGDENVLIFGYDAGILQLGVKARTVFDYDSDNEVGITIGFYDLQNNLIDKGSQMTRVTQSGTIAYFKNELKDKAIEYIMNKQGYVRFFGHLYASGAFDIKVPCMKNPQPKKNTTVRKNSNTSRKQIPTRKK